LVLDSSAWQRLGFSASYNCWKSSGVLLKCLLNSENVVATDFTSDPKTISNGSFVFVLDTSCENSDDNNFV